MMMIQGRELLVEEGVRVEITCQAQGRPQPEVIVIVMLVMIFMMKVRMVMSLMMSKMSMWRSLARPRAGRIQRSL